MTTHFPIVFETEENGAVSAYVPGLPVYAAADTRAKAERAIGALLQAYVTAHPTRQSGAEIRVARVSSGRPGRLDIVGLAALVGATTSRAKARASRANGRLGGRPRAAATSERRTKMAR